MPMVRNIQAASVQGLHPARPGGIDPAVDQRGDGEGEGNRKADIARIEKRRVEGERRILQDGVQAIALDRRRIEARKGFDVGHDEQQEGRADRALDGERARELERQIAAEQRDGGAE